MSKDGSSLMNSLKQKIVEKLEFLPETALQEVLNFVDFLEWRKVTRKESEKSPRLEMDEDGSYDALIAQAAIKANVDVLLTLNPNDFTRFGEDVA